MSLPRIWTVSFSESAGAPVRTRRVIGYQRAVGRAVALSRRGPSAEAFVSRWASKRPGHLRFVCGPIFKAGRRDDLTEALA